MHDVSVMPMGGFGSVSNIFSVCIIFMGTGCCTRFGKPFRRVYVFSVGQSWNVCFHTKFYYFSDFFNSVGWLWIVAKYLENHSGEFLFLYSVGQSWNVCFHTKFYYFIDFFNSVG